MKENNKSVLLAVVSGIIACIVCVGVVFMFPTNKNNLKNNESLNNNVNLNNNEREVKLGDTCSNYGEWNASGQTRVVSSIGLCSSAPPISGTTWCKLIRTVNNETECAGEGLPGVSTCYVVQDQTRACNDTPLSTATLTCHNRTYNGAEQVIATCTGCTISYNARATAAGGWTVTATANDGYAWSDGTIGIKNCTATISKATPNIIFNGATLNVGENQVLSATTSPNCNSNITYSTQGDGSVIIEDGHAVAISAGSTTIRAVSQENSNCNQATKDVVITVTQSTKTCYKLYLNKCTQQEIQAATCDNTSGYYATQDECNSHVIKCPAGKGYDPSASSNCSYCSPGYYSPDNDAECHKCDPGKFSPAGATSADQCVTATAPCCENPYGRKIEHDTVEACQAAINAGKTVTPGHCVVDTVIKAVTASYSGTVYLNPTDYENGDGEQYGYKTVTYTALDGDGRAIAASKVSWRVQLSGNAASVVSQGVSGNSYVVTYRGKGCIRATSEVFVTASGSSGVSTGSANSPIMTIKVNEYTKWSRSNWNKENSSNWPLLAEGVDHEQCNAVSDPYEENGVTKYRYRYNRCGCGGGGTTYSFCCVSNDGSNYNWLTGQSSKTCPSGYTIDNTRTATTCLKTYACYKDSNNQVHWTSMPESSWVRIDKPESECKDQEACFENTQGTRVWGKYYDQIVNGYKLITTIKDPSTCLYPGNDDACYVNNNDPADYRWSSDALTGYTKVEGVTNVKDCQPEACYIKIATNEFEFGKYGDTEGYIPVYKTIQKGGEYVDVLITNQKECTNEVPVPPTALDVAKLVYVFMAILMACGIGFIYYSTVAQKQSQ